MQGHGWNDEGIEAFNKNLMFVMEDREKRGNEFDKQLKQQCEKAMGINGSSTSKVKRKREAGDPPQERTRCLTAKEFRTKNATVAATSSVTVPPAARNNNNNNRSSENRST